MGRASELGQFDVLWSSRRRQGAEGPLDAWRKAAFARAADLQLPTKRDEAWKYTALAETAAMPWQLGHAAAGAEAGGADDVARSLVSELLVPAVLRLVFVDGVLSPGLSGTVTPVAGVESATMAAAVGSAQEQWWTRCAPGGGAVVPALTAALAGDGAGIWVKAGTDVPAVIHLVHVSTRHEPTLSAVAHVIHVEANARVTFVEHFTYAPDSVGFSLAWTQVTAGPNADVRWVKVVGGVADARHLGVLDVELERGARWASHLFAFGGRLVRNEVNVRMGGSGAEASLDGLYLVRGTDHVDCQTRVDHAAPHGISRQLYKGILDGASRGVFAGKVHVAPHAQKTDAEQRNRNLLLSVGAEVDAKPELEIYADDVRCAHGATVGALDADALFYLRSRGIDPDGARSLLTYGFASEMVDRLPTALLHALVAAPLKRWLPSTDALREIP